MKLSCVSAIIFLLSISIAFTEVLQPKSKIRPPAAPKLNAQNKARCEKLVNAYLPKLWTNDYSRFRSIYYHDDISGLDHSKYVRASIRNGGDVCKFTFLTEYPNKLISLYNTSYSKMSDKYYCKPKYVTKEIAKNRAEEVSNLFGITNIWDESLYTVQYQEFDYGVWSFNLTAIINGYPSLYGVSVSIADTQETNIYRWSTTMHDIPSDLGTNVVLSAAEGCSKGTEYLRKYYPDKEAAVKATFITNKVEYITPNYHYIKENGLDEFYDGGHTNRPVLTWVNFFKNNIGSKYDRHFPIIIYVDAETGEMLGGT
ncbi:MAG: hypothetical protein PHY48_15645 [Candidatus Cloacimonetes bacterium]|nr:hypothetical protein [Candidatus Cloacimonadota bacterium]